jgi:hypothetical protein
MLFASAAVVAAQTPGQTRVTPAIQIQAFALDNFAPGLASRATPDDVVTRLMSFDRDQDGKLSPSELPERMQPLITRGDADFDGALDASEVRTIALAPTAPVTARGFHSGGYGFADEVGFSSSRSHIDGALDDLGLPQNTRQEAGAIVSAFMDALEADASANLMKDLARVLNSAQLVEFRNALDNQDENRRFFATRQPGGVMRLVVQGRLEVQIEQFGLKPDDKRSALAAVDQFKARLRMNDADRAALLAPMKDLLTGEQREDLQAALARRPLVKNGAVGGIISGATFTGKVPMIDVAQPVPAILVR